MIWKPKPQLQTKGRTTQRSPRLGSLEALEPRRLMVADPIHVGVVFIETDLLDSAGDVGGDSAGDRFIVSFTGGADGTELSELRIRTDKAGDDVSIGDPIFDTQPGGRGTDGNQNFQIVEISTTDGRQIEATAEVQDGGQELVLRLSNFRAGDRLEFSIDVDEVLRNAIDLEVFNAGLDVITSGQEFQDSLLAASFEAPHFEPATADAIFVNDFGDPASTLGLNIPSDDGDDPIESLADRSAAAVQTTQQTPSPIDLSGQVFIDSNLDLVRDPGERPLAGVELALLRQADNGEFVDTGFRSVTDSDGQYVFPRSLGLLPGVYQITQSQPDGLLSVGAIPGTVAGNPTGIEVTENLITNIQIPLGDTSAVNFDFAEAEPASLSGFVFVDADNDGVRDAGEQPIAGVEIQLVPTATIAPAPTLTTTTDADGSYSFSGLVPGFYEVIQVAQPPLFNDGIDRAGTINGVTVGFALNPGDSIVGIQLQGGDEGVEFNFGETPLGSLSGFVDLAAPGTDGQGDRQTNGSTPLAGVALQLRDGQGNLIDTTTTSADGFYEFTQLPIGVYQLVEVTPDGLIDGFSTAGFIDGFSAGQNINGGLIDQITLNPGSEGTQFNFVEFAPATLGGFVFVDQSDDGVRDADETPIEGVLITLVDSTGNPVATAFTDEEGRYEFEGLLPGEYTVIESQPAGFLDGIDAVGTVDGITVGQNLQNDVITAILLPQGTVGSEFNFGELLGASLSGQVHSDDNGNGQIDDTEELIAGVTIRLLDSDGQQVAQTVTDAMGTYTFANLVPGTYSVVQEQPEGFFEGDAVAGSSGGQVIGPNQISSITLESGEIATGYNFCEHPPAEISGRVFVHRGDQEINRDTDPGIPNVVIELFNQAGELVATTTTDSQGDYRFDNLPEGVYTLRQTQPDGFLQGGQLIGSGGGDDSIVDQISEITIDFGDDLTQYDFYEFEPALVSGRVFQDNNLNNTQDPSEPGIPDVVIKLLDESGEIIDTTTTDENGDYQFDNLPPGIYQISEKQPEGFFQGGQSTDSDDAVVLGDDLIQITLDSGDEIENVDFFERLPSSISGRVFQEPVPNGVFDQDDLPIAGVEIELRDDDGNLVDRTLTDDDGNYQFDGLAPGAYSVRETQPDGFFDGADIVGSAGGQLGENDLVVGIELLGGTEATGYDFAEIPPVTISGFVFQDGEAIVTDDPPNADSLRDFRDGVFTSDDVPLAGVTIELRNVLGQPIDGSDALPGVFPDGPISVTTDADGFYEFVGLRPGSFSIFQAQPENFLDGLDTPGSTGGFAVNPADLLSQANQIVVQTLTASDETNPNNDAILNLFLVGGQTSQQNNFSEILIEDPPAVPTPPFPLEPLPQRDPPPATPIPVVEIFEAPERLAIFSFTAPRLAPVEIFDEFAVTWHLSVINGGFSSESGVPSGTLGENGIIENVAFRDIQKDWAEGTHDQGKWQIANRLGEAVDWADAFDLGEEEAIALVGDFDGDGKDEPAIFVGGQWFVDVNGNGQWDAGDLWIGLGNALDRPVVGDWDGDGKDDVGIFGRSWQRDGYRIRRDPGLPDPANIRRRMVDARKIAHRGDEAQVDDPKRLMIQGTGGTLRADAVDHVFQYGEHADVPIAGDWNGDGIDQIGVFRSGRWLLDSDGDGRWTHNDSEFRFGQPGDQPVVGDFNGDLIDELAVVRGDVWIIDTDGDRKITGNDLHIQVPRESSDSQPIAGDFDGDGKAEPGYYDEAA